MPNDLNKASAAAVTKVLADTFVLYAKTHTYHWNVEGREFLALHGLFEEQYRDLWAALDVLAERIRALGEFTPGSFAQFAALATVTENETIPDAQGMLQQLIAGNEAVAQTLRHSIQSVQDVKDEPTAGMLIDRLARHEQQIWMMKSMTR